MKFLFLVLAVIIAGHAEGQEIFVMPSEIRHDYENQQLIFRGLKFEGHNLYNVKIGSLKFQAYFQKDKEGEYGTLLCLLPNEPRLKPGIHEIQANLNQALVAKAQIRVLDNPFAPKPSAVWRDKIFALAIFLIVLVVLIALISALRATVKEKKKDFD